MISTKLEHKYNDSGMHRIVDSETGKAGDWATYEGIAIYLEHIQANPTHTEKKPMFFAVTEFFSGVLSHNTILEVQGDGVLLWARKAISDRRKDRMKV